MPRDFYSLKPNFSIFTPDGYFPSKSKGCAIASLANLIYIQYHDLTTAIRIYFNSRNHPLVESDGTTDMASLPLILEDLSRKKYSCKFYLNPSLDYNLDNLQLKGDSLKRVKEAFKTSLERHLIVLERNYPVKYPNILFLINSNPNISGHALVNKSRSVFINNGYIDYSLPSGFDIEGVLCASKKR